MHTQVCAAACFWLQRKLPSVQAEAVFCIQTEGYSGEEYQASSTENRLKLLKRLAGRCPSQGTPEPLSALWTYKCIVTEFSFTVVLFTPVK